MKITDIYTLIEEFRNGRDIWSRTAVELAVREIVRLRKRIAELEQERRWIPVSERLPECGEIVSWSHTSWKRTKEGYITANGRLNVWGGEYLITNKMKWQPLPQPPESEEE